jgi:hypothetical protein
VGTNRANTGTHLEYVGTSRIYTAAHLELCGYQPGQYCPPLGIMRVPTRPILPPAWNYVGSNRIYTAAHLELCGYQPDLYCRTHLEMYGYQPDQYCVVHNQSPPWKQMDPHGALGTPASVGPPTFQKALPKALSKDLPKKFLLV